jgi:hypothetical protein
MTRLKGFCDDGAEGLSLWRVFLKNSLSRLRERVSFHMERVDAAPAVRAGKKAAAACQKSRTNFQ